MKDQRHNETIVDHTPKTPFQSPLTRFIEANCKQCNFFGGRCRAEDSRGLTPMSLCIHLYIHEQTTKLTDVFTNGLIKTAETSEQTLEEVEPHADTE
jgi:hypothetical protein